MPHNDHDAIRRANTEIADTITLPYVSTERAKRFWRDIIRHCSSRLDDEQFPELAALLTAIEDATGGAPNEPMAIIESGMVYCLAVLAKLERRFAKADLEIGYDHPAVVVMLLENFMDSIKQCIEQDKSIRHTQEGIFIDFFHVPQWFYDELLHNSTTEH
jgi:hypothetical protein